MGDCAAGLDVTIRCTYDGPMNDTDRRRERIPVPVTTDEKQTIEDAARRVGMPVAVYMRSLALRAAKEQG